MYTDNFLQHIKTIEKELNSINKIGHDGSNIFKTIINLSPNAIFIAIGDNFVYANPSAISHLGLESMEDVLNQSLLSTVHIDYREKVKKRLDDVHKGIRNKPITIKLLRPDNEDIYIESISIPIRFEGNDAALIVARNITKEYKLKIQLEEKEKLLIETEKQSKTGSFRLNLKTGNATWSQGLYDIFNLSYDTPPPDTKAYLSYVHPDDIDKVRELNSDCHNKNENFDLSYRIILPGKIEKWIQQKCEVKTSVNGDKYLVGFYKDITSEVEQKNKVEESEDYVRLLFDTIQEGIALNEAIYDEEGNIVDYKILIANHAFDRNSEYSANDVIGKTASEAYKMDKEYIKEWWINNKNADFPVYTEMFRPDVERWAYISTSKVVNNKFVTAFFDISDKKKKDILLEESEKTYKNLVENSPTGVAQITRDKLLFANKYFLNLLGYNSYKEIANKNIIDFIPASDKCKLANILNSTNLKYKNHNYLTQVKINNISGAEKEVEMLISVIKTKPETTWQCIISDISEKSNLIRKAKRVSTDAIFLSRKLELFSEIESQLDTIIKNNKLEKNTFKELYERLKQDKNIEQLWSVFQNNFEIIYIDFFEKLHALSPSLTQQELKHCAFIKMNFETKEIASLFHVKPSSIQTSRVRLKKKLGLKPNQDLINFIISL